MAELIIELILKPIVEIILNPIGNIVQSVGRHVGFLLHYKRNLKDLDNEVKNLQEQRTNVDGKVKEARHRGEAIDDNVEVWLINEDEVKKGVDQFTAEKDRKKNILLCFNFSCPNFISRYRLSKEAKKKVVDIKDCIQRGGQLTISHPKGNPPELEILYSKDYHEGFYSRDKVLKDIVEALEDPKVNMIRVYGIGGVGKTTMVKKVGSLLEENKTFDEVIMAVVSQDANVSKIQEQLAKQLKLSLSGDESERAAQLWNRLDNREKNLILLDDVWQELNLKDIGIPFKDDNNSCQIMLTSRKKDVWKNMGTSKDFEIGILSKEESWTLFKNMVENFGVIDELVARAVCEECQGLPVAIIALGAALKDKDIYAWEDARDKLKNSMLNDIEGMDPKLYISLRWSYDRLDSKDAKTCFLLCCLYPEDGEIHIEGLVRYYMAERSFHRDQKPDTSEGALYRVRNVVDTLKGSCLLQAGNYNEASVKMHDIVRDIAISIAKAEKSFLVKHGVKRWPNKATYEHCSVMFLTPNGMREFPDELSCPELHTLRLDCSSNEFQLQVPDRFFNGTENLTIVHFNNVTMSPVLPASLAKLAKLQMLCLDGCKLGDISILKDLKDHLEILSLQDSNIKALPLEVGELTRLRHLDMDRCKELEVIPAGIISKLCCLEDLYMPWTFGQWEGATAGTERDISVVGLDELMSLTQLTTLHIFIPDAALLPEHFTFENLVTFRIAVGETDDRYHDYSTGRLKLAHINLAINLQGLLGKPCVQRNRLTPSKSLGHLVYLSITDCRLKYLFSPSSARGLVRLKKLKIEQCVDMEGVIGNEGEEDEDIIISFSRLNELSLKNLPKLISFYPEKEKKTTNSESSSAHAQTAIFTDKVTFPVLETLLIERVPKVTEIWYIPTFWISKKEIEPPFNQLQNLLINHCENLMTVVGGYTNVQASVTEKQEVSVDEHCVVRFHKLKKLQLLGLCNLKGFCSRPIRCEVLGLGNLKGFRSRPIRCEAQPLFDHQVTLPVLETLLIERVPKVTEIWYIPTFWISKKEIELPFNQLQSLVINHCEKLITVVGGYTNVEASAAETQEGSVDDHCVHRFPKLKFLRLLSLLNLKGFCSRSIRCEAQPLFDHQVTFPVLETLLIERVPKVTEIWYIPTFWISKKEIEPPFNQLQNLLINHCENLMTVVGGYTNVQASVTEKQEGSVDEHCVVRFHKLKKLHLLGLCNLKGFCSRPIRCEVLGLGNLKGFRSRPIRCEAQPLFDHQVALPALEELRISMLPHVRNIWDKKLGAAESFPMRTLEVSKCSELMNVVQFTMLPQLRTSKELILESCPLVEATVDLDKRKEQTKNAANNTIIPFPELEYLALEDLQNIKGFCSFRSEEQPVFNAQVAFPKLTKLVLRNQGERAVRHLMGAWKMNSKTKLHLLNIDRDEIVVSSHLFRWLQNVELFWVGGCARVAEVFNFDGLEVGEGEECIGPLAQVNKIQFESLPQLTCLWNKDPYGFLALQNLEYLTITDCPLLRNLFTVSVAKALGGLKVLYLMSCSTMEEVIATEEAYEDVIGDHEIVFPKLEWLILKDLSNLKSFCGGTFDFNLPSLQKVVIKKCPNMQTFSSGSVNMRRTSFITKGNDGLVIEDLNKHIQQQHSKGEEMEGDGLGLFTHLLKQLQQLVQGEAIIKELEGDEDQFKRLSKL